MISDAWRTFKNLERVVSITTALVHKTEMTTWASAKVEVSNVSTREKVGNTGATELFKLVLNESNFTENIVQTATRFWEFTVSYVLLSLWH